MANKTLNKDLSREIRRTFSRFISIVLLVTIAVCFLFGLRMAAPVMESSMDDYLDQQKLMDVHILSTLGLTDGDIDAVAAVEDTLDAEGAYAVDALASRGEDTTTVKVISCSSRINVPALTSGRFPEGADECLVEGKLLTELGVQLGDTIQLDTGTGSYENTLRQQEFTIVGTATSPLYISVTRGTSTLGNGSVSSIVTLAPEAFDMDYYTDVYIRVAGAEAKNAYSEDYDRLIERYTDRLETIQATREQARTEQVIRDAEQELADGWQEYYDAEADANKELADAEQELSDARKELADGWQEYNDGAEELEDARLAVASGGSALVNAKQTLNSGEAAYASGVEQYDAAKADYETGRQEYKDGLAQYKAGEAAYKQGQAQYKSGKAAYDSGLAQYKQGKQQYDASKAQYDAAKTQYDSGVTALNAQRAQLIAAGYSEEQADSALAEATAQLAATKQQLDGWKDQLSAASAQLTATKAQLDSSKRDLDAAKQQLSSTRKTLDATKKTLDAAKKTLDAGKQQLADAKQELSDSRSTLDSGWKDFQTGVNAVHEAKGELADGEQELRDAYQELTDGQQEYEDGLKEYTDAKAEAEQELFDARQELADARQKIDDIAPAEWYILDRDANMGFASYHQDASRMNKLAALFPTVFFLVAALVCLNAMTRMVEDQRVQIGGLKALGYSKPAIARKYVGYGLLASLIGSVVGLAVGGTAIPYVIVSCWKILYTFPGVRLDFQWTTAVLCVAAAIACCTVAVLAAALTALRATPAALMRPRAPEPGKRIWLEQISFIWKRMSFTQKVTARNLLRYQKRFWMTVIGITGCTALMVTGFGLHDSIMDVIDLQFGQISTYSAVAYLNEDADAARVAALDAALSRAEGLEQHSRVYAASVTLESGSYSLNGNLISAERAEDLDGFWHFRDRKTGRPLAITGDGALLSEKTAQLLDVGVGDRITVVSGDDRGTVTVTGIMENYVQHYVFLTADSYESAFGIRPEANELLLGCTDDTAAHNLGGELLQLEAVSGVYYLSESLELFRTQMEGINPAVIIIISAAAALAFVVLYNLSSINITERKRELATLRVLGFRDSEMRSYVFRENVILTLIGMAFGAVAGKYFHAYLITTVEIELCMFGRNAHVMSYVLALLLTLVFSLLVNEVAGRSLAKIDMVESLKTVE